MSDSNATISERTPMTLLPYEPDRSPWYNKFFPLAKRNGHERIPIAAPSPLVGVLYAMPPYHDCSTL